MQNNLLPAPCRVLKNRLRRAAGAGILVASSLLPGRLLAQSPAAPEIPPPTRTASKARIYGEVGFGVNKILLFGDTRAQLVRALGGSADFGAANNLLAGFFVAPERWRGLGAGFHMSGTFGAPVTGDFGDQYIFNAYNVGVAAKYYPLSRQFNRGLYGRGSVGFGQFTTKRFRKDANFYRHQYALGSSLMGALGYSLQLKGYSLGLEMEVESASRSGTVDGLGSQTFRSGQLGVNLVVSF